MRRANKTEATPTKAVAYIRVSTEQQADGGVSLDAQRAKLEAYAALYEIALVDVIVDAGVSAKSLNRPGLERALSMLDSGAADAILVAKLDRLTRSVRDLGELVETYFASGKSALLSVAENIDTRSAGGRLVLNVLASVAQWEREACGERTSAALQQVKAEGGRLGGEALGWSRTDETDAEGRRAVAEIVEEVETVRRIRDLRDAGESLRRIAAALDAEGRKTKKGGRWAPETVRKVLRRAEAS